MNAKIGDNMASGRPVVNQCTIIFNKIMVSSGRGKRLRKSKLPSSKSKRKNLSNVITTANSDPIHKIVGAMFERAEMFTVIPRGVKNRKIVKKLSPFIIEPPVLNTSFNSHFRYANIWDITSLQPKKGRH